MRGIACVSAWRRNVRKWAEVIERAKIPKQ